MICQETVDKKVCVCSYLFFFLNSLIENICIYISYKSSKGKTRFVKSWISNVFHKGFWHKSVYICQVLTFLSLRWFLCVLMPNIWEDLFKITLQPCLIVYNMSHHTRSNDHPVGWLPTWAVFLRHRATINCHHFRICHNIHLE